MELALLAKSPIGVFVFSENGKLVYYELYGKDPKTAVSLFTEGKSPEVKGYEIKEDEKAYEFLRKNIREYATTFGEFTSEEFSSFVANFSSTLSRKNMKIDRDKIIIQSSRALDDLNKISGVCFERTEEWFGLHYPEFRSSKMDIVDKIIKYGSKENFPEFKDSIGVDFSEEDETAIKNFASMVKKINDEKAKLEKYVEIAVQEVAPNFSSVVEPVLAAKLLSNAGSLEKLARMPASTIQLLGSEKALFRHLKKKGNSPKYGLLFLDKRVNEAPENRRGKIARLISSKLMLAARVDFYSKRDIKKKLNKELDENIIEVLEK